MDIVLLTGCLTGCFSLGVSWGGLLGVSLCACRWHPDKFSQKFGNCLHEVERDKIMERVKETFQLVQETTNNLGF